MILGLYILFKRAYSIQGSVFLLFSVSLTLCLSVSVSVCLSLSLALCEGSIGGLGFVSECWRRGRGIICGWSGIFQLIMVGLLMYSSD